MSNILPQPNQSITPPPISLEREAARAVDLLISSAKGNYQSLCRSQKDAIRTVWNHHRLTPQQVCDALGIKAVKLFDFHAALTECIVKIAARDGVQPDILLPTNAFTRNEDGTITISDQPYQP